MKSRSRSVILDERVARRLHTDTRPLLVGSPDNWQDIHFQDGSFQDEFRVVWRRAGDGHYAPTGNPLREATLADLDTFPWPDPRNPGRQRGLRQQARQLHEETDYAVVLSLPVGFVHLSQYLRGYEQWLMDIVLNPEFLDALLDRVLYWWLASGGRGPGRGETLRGHRGHRRRRGLSRSTHGRSGSLSPAVQAPPQADDRSGQGQRRMGPRYSITAVGRSSLSSRSSLTSASTLSTRSRCRQWAWTPAR